MQMLTCPLHFNIKSKYLIHQQYVIINCSCVNNSNSRYYLRLGSNCPYNSCCFCSFLLLIGSRSKWRFSDVVSRSLSPRESWWLMQHNKSMTVLTCGRATRVAPLVQQGSDWCFTYSTSNLPLTKLNWHCVFSLFHKIQMALIARLLWPGPEISPGVIWHQNGIQTSARLYSAFSIP